MNMNSTKFSEILLLKHGFICKIRLTPKTFIYNDYQPNYTPIKGYVLEGCKHRALVCKLDLQALLGKCRRSSVGRAFGC